MSNATTLQQNNIRLNENNNDLTSVLNTINSLPEVIEIVLQEKSAIPTTEEQEVIADEGYTGLSKVTVAGEENLIADNIKQGVSIFGVEGNAKTSNLKITDASYLFYGRARIDYFNELLSLCENVTDTKYMFYNCSSLTELDLSNFNTNNSTSMSNMFYQCSNLTELDLSNFNTINVTNMDLMFFGCSKLTNLDLTNFNTSNVTSLSNTFYDCSKLTNLDLSNFDGSKIIAIPYFINGCSNLTNLKFMRNLGKGYTKKSNNYSNYTLTLSSCTKLTHDSLMNVINNLYDLNLSYDVANGGTLYTQKLVLGSTNMAKLTSSELELATSKGWSVS